MQPLPLTKQSWKCSPWGLLPYPPGKSGALLSTDQCPTMYGHDLDAMFLFIYLSVNLIFNLIVCLFVFKCCYAVLDALPYHFWLLCTLFIAHHATINVKYWSCTNQKLCFLNLFPVDSPLAGDWNWQRSLVRAYQYGKLDKDWTTFMIFCRRQYCNFIKWPNSKTWKSACFLFYSWFGCMAVRDQFLTITDG